MVILTGKPWIIMAGSYSSMYVILESLSTIDEQEWYVGRLPKDEAPRKEYHAIGFKVKNLSNFSVSFQVRRFRFQFMSRLSETEMVLVCFKFRCYCIYKISVFECMCVCEYFLNESCEKNWKLKLIKVEENNSSLRKMGNFTSFQQTISRCVFTKKSKDIYFFYTFI